MTKLNVALFKVSLGLAISPIVCLGINVITGYGAIASSTVATSTERSSSRDDLLEGDWLSQASTPEGSISTTESDSTELDSSAYESLPVHVISTLLLGISIDGDQIEEIEAISPDSVEREFDNIIRSYIQRAIRPHLGRPLDRQAIEADLERIRDLGLFHYIDYDLKIIANSPVDAESQSVRLDITAAVSLYPADRFWNAGRRLYDLKDPNLLSDADRLLTRASELLSERPDRKDYAAILNDLCNLYSGDIFYQEAITQNTKTIETCQDALRLSREFNIVLGEFILLGKIGQAYHRVGEFEKATQYLAQAVNLLDSIDLDVISQDELFGEAIDSSTSEPLVDNVKQFLSGFAKMWLSEIGRSFVASGSYQSGLYTYLSAASPVNLTSTESVDNGNPQAESSVSNQGDGILSAFSPLLFQGLAFSGISGIYKSLADSRLSQEYQELYLKTWLNTYGFALESQDSVAFFGGSGFVDSERILENLPFRLEGDALGVEESTFLTQLGQFFLLINNLDSDDERMLSVMDFFAKIYGKADQKNDLVFWLNGKANLLHRTGRHEEALLTYLEAAELLRELSNAPSKISNQMGLGKTYRALGDQESSIAALEQARDQILTVTRDSTQLGDVYFEVGETYLEFGNYDDALSAYTNSLEVWRNLNNFLKTSESLHRMALAYDRQGNFAAAQNHMDMSLAELELGGVEKVESISSLLEGYSLQVYKTYQELSKYFQSKREYYDSYIEMLAQQAQVTANPALKAEAFAISEQSRARSLQLFLGRASASITAQGEAVTDLTTETLARIQPLGLPEIQQQVITDDQTVLLEYALGDTQSHLWVVGQHQMEYYPLPGREEIEAKARTFYSYLTVPDQRVRPRKGVEAGEALVRAILPPAALAQLEGKTRLLVVGDGLLQYIPFHALPNPQPTVPPQGVGSRWADHMEPMLVQYEVISLPSASVLAMIRQADNPRPQPTREIGVFADPVFGHEDSRFKGRFSDITLGQGISVLPAGGMDALPEQLFSRLPGTQDEAATILAIANDPTSTAWMGFEAGHSTAMGDLSDYRIVHFATHGLLDTQEPQRSGMILSSFDDQGGLQRSMLSTVDTFNMQLNADLVVLSGCRTGLDADPSAPVQGEGLFGMTGGLMYAGADRVVSSLWSVQSDATNTLMQRFYSNIYDEAADLTIAQSLRQAQLSMWAEPQWQNPYHWAAFTLQGEWQ